MVIDFNKGNGGGGSGYTLPIASEQQLGGIKVGSGLSITTAGTLSADAQPVGVATTASTGIVQVGSGLSITSGGVLSADGVDLTNYVQEQELSGYQTTQAMSGYQTTQAMSAYQTTQGMSGYVQTNQIANENDLGLVKIGEGINLAEDGTISVEGGEEIEKASTDIWGTLKLANGIALEVNDSDEWQGVVLGVSAGENVVWGNGVGEAENNAKGLRKPVQSYTQYDLDIYDDHDNSICVVDNGVGTIDFKNFVLGSDGTYFFITNGDNLAERFIRIYVEEGVPYVECSTDGGSESCEIQFQNDGDYKDFRLEIGSTVLQVFESYDNYENIIAEIENAEFVVGYGHIQLFDKDYDMESGAIGTIIFNNTDFIKPYYDYDGDSVQNVGFVLKKRSYNVSR